MVEVRNRNTKRPHLVACKNLHLHDLNVFPKRHYCRRMPHFVKKQGSNLAHCFGILGFLCCPIILDALERLKNVFIYAQTFWALWKNPKAQKMWGTLKILYGKIVKVENSCLLLPTILGALSHERE
jgi:hypothetical protein